MGKKKHHSFQVAFTFVALQISFVNPDSWTGPITKPHAAHMILFLENELKPLEIFSELVVIRKEKGERIFRYQELNPDRRGTKLVFKFMKVLRAIYYTISDDSMLFGNSKSYLVVHLIERRFGSPKVIVKGPLMSPNFRPLNTIKYRQV